MALHWAAVTRYEAALFRASYYRWCAARGFALSGNDPVTGLARGRFGGVHGRNESRAAYLALARFWLDTARGCRPVGVLP